MTFIRPKFSDCKSCVYFNKQIQNAACKLCDAGEMFEQRISTREKTRHELMDLYKEDFENDDE